MDGLTRPDAESPLKEPNLEPQAAADSPSVVLTLEPATPQGPGAVLRREREARGYTIDSVAEALKLAPRQVEAIEVDDFEALRGQTFARGFVKNYARLLQLDPEPLVARIQSSAPQARVVLEPRSNVPSGLPLTSASSGPVVAGGLAVAALVVVALVGTSAGWLGGDPALRKDVSAPLPGSVLSDNTSAPLNTPPPVSPLASSLPAGASAVEGASGSVTNEPAGASVAVTSTLATSVAGAAGGPAGQMSKPVASALPNGVSAAVRATPQAAPLSATPAVLRATSASVAVAPAMTRSTSASGAPTTPAAATSGATAVPAGTSVGSVATSTTSATAGQPARRTSATVLSFATGKPVTVTEAAPTAAAPRAVSSTSSAQPSAGATPGRGERRLFFNFDQEAWVEVKDGEGKVVFSQLSPAGSTRMVSGKGPLTFVVGNAHHVKLRVDDKAFDIKPHIGVTVARFSVE